MLIFGFKLLDKLQENPGDFLQKIALLFLKLGSGFSIVFFIISFFGITTAYDPWSFPAVMVIMSIIGVAIITIVLEATTILMYGILYGLGRLVETNQKQLEILENSTPAGQRLSQKIQDDELPML